MSRYTFVLVNGVLEHIAKPSDVEDVQDMLRDTCRDYLCYVEDNDGHGNDHH